MNLTHKNHSVQIKDLDVKQGIVTVYGSAFNIKDSDGDVITKGAYSKTIAENGPSARNRIWKLINHDTSQYVAKPFEIKEDSYGLLASTKMPNTTRAKDLLALYEEGHITEHSVGFMPVKQQQKDGYNEITEIKLYEYSAVLWGANEFTPTVSVKSLDKTQLIDEIKKTTKSLRNWKGTEETFELLEIKLIQLTDQLDAFVKSVGEEVAASSTMNTQPDEAQLKALLDSLETKYNNMIKSE